jgi:hypothetical protein
MRITNTFDHLGRPLIRHIRSHGKPPVVIVEPPRQHHHKLERAGQQRWRAASYTDPWPDRA